MGLILNAFTPVDKLEARKQLGLPQNAKVLISVGALVERKGMHRVLDCLPALLDSHPDLHYLIVGGANPEGDMSAELQRQAAAAGIA